MRVWRGQARQDPALASAALATGDTPESDRQDGAGEPAECDPLEPFDHGRGGGDFAVECQAHLGRGRSEAASDEGLQGVQRPDVRRKSHRHRRALEILNEIRRNR